MISFKFYNIIYIFKPKESDVVEIGTMKGDNKESFLERVSEMRRLPDIQENLDQEHSL